MNMKTSSHFLVFALLLSAVPAHAGWGEDSNGTVTDGGRRTRTGFDADSGDDGSGSSGSESGSSSDGSSASGGSSSGSEKFGVGSGLAGSALHASGSSSSSSDGGSPLDDAPDRRRAWRLAAHGSRSSVPVSLFFGLSPRRRRPVFTPFGAFSTFVITCALISWIASHTDDDEYRLA